MNLTKQFIWMTDDRYLLVNKVHQTCVNIETKSVCEINIEL